jgi:hypothetical protein
LRDWHSVKDFGAVGDGTTDDSAAFQDALNKVARVYVPYSAAGYVVDSLVLTSNTALVAENQQLIIANDTFATIGTTGVDIRTYGVTVRGFDIDMRGAGSGTAAFLFAAGGGANRNRQWNISIENINTIGAYATVKQDDDEALSYLFHCYFHRVNAYFPRGTSWELPNVQGFVLLRFCQVDWTGDSVVCEPMVGETVATAFTAGYPAFLIGGANARSVGIQLEWCVVSSNQTHDNSTGHGFVLRNVTAPTLMNCEADGITGAGFKIGDAGYVNVDADLLSVSHLVMSDCVAFFHGENGIDFSNVASAQLTNNRAVGRSPGSTGNAAQVGWRIDDSHDISQSGLVILNARGDGISASDTSDMAGGDCRVRDCGGKAVRFNTVNNCIMGFILDGCADGLYLTGTSQDNTFSGLISRNHTAGSGVKFDGANVFRNRVANVSLINNSAYGRHDLNGSSANLLIGGHIVDNATNNIVQLGANSASVSYVNDADTYVAASTGAGTF